jgi:hypothetical protein
VTTLLDHAEELSGIQGHQDLVIAKDVASMVGQLDGHKQFPSLVHQALPVIIKQHAHAAGLYTAHWYDGIEPGSKYRAKPVIDIAPEQIAKTVDWALYAPGDEPTVSRLTGSTQRIVRGVSRNTVTGNAAKEGVRWARYAKATACAYCRALSMRGTGEDQKWLYHSEESAIHRKSDGEKYHTHCECVPVKVPNGQLWVPPGHAADWDKQYAAAAKKTPRGPKYFQRIAAQMEADAPEKRDRKGSQEEAPPETEKLTPPTVLKPQLAPPEPEPEPEPEVDEAHQALREQLDAATDFRGIHDTARKLFPETNVDIGYTPHYDDVLLRQSDYGSPTLWDAKVPAVQENIKGVLRAVDDVMTKYPGLQLDGLEAAADSSVYRDPKTYAHADHDWAKDTFTVRMNRKYVVNPATTQQVWDIGVEDGFHYPGGDNPVYAVITHEMGHVVQQNAEKHGVFITNTDITRALSEFFFGTVGAPVQPATMSREDQVAALIKAYDAWLTDNLSGYSTHFTLPQVIGGQLRKHGPDLTTTDPINGREALAEAFADVEINGDEAHDTSKVMHALLIDAYAEAMAKKQSSGLATAV